MPSCSILSDINMKRINLPQLRTASIQVFVVKRDCLLPFSSFMVDHSLMMSNEGVDTKAEIYFRNNGETGRGDHQTTPGP
jgi:hypothetical protein